MSYDAYLDKMAEDYMNYLDDMFLLGEPPEETDDDCLFCGGGGERVCHACNGAGAISTVNDDEGQRCSACDGWGVTPCDYCGDVGESAATGQRPLPGGSGVTQLISNPRRHGKTKALLQALWDAAGFAPAEVVYHAQDGWYAVAQEPSEDFKKQFMGRNASEVQIWIRELVDDRKRKADGGAVPGAGEGA